MEDVPQGKQTVTDDEIVEMMRDSPDPAFTTAEVADAFDMGVEGMRNRLGQLEENGRLYRKKPSPRTVIWWSESDHGAEALSA